jgi:hypothetical protein
MDFCVSHCVAWAPDIAGTEQWREWSQGGREAGIEGTPKAARVPPLMRRRLTRWGRLALEAGGEVAEQLHPDTPVIFSSRHGDTALTQELLRDLAKGEALSPTSFSLSVHNAAAGLFTITEKLTGPSLALAAGRETFAHAWLEAGAWLAEGHQQVLLLHAEEPLSGFYAQDADESELAVGAALVLTARAGTRVRFNACGAATGAQPAPRSLITEFLAWWFGGTQRLNYTGERLNWSWERQNDSVV